MNVKRRKPGYPWMETVCRTLELTDTTGGNDGWANIRINISYGAERLIQSNTLNWDCCINSVCRSDFGFRG